MDQTGGSKYALLSCITSGRARKNAITSISHEGSTITCKDQIKQVLFEQLKLSMGSSVTTEDFNPTTLYPIPNPNLLDLDAPFTEQEIEMAVLGLKDNRASGPDGLPNELAKKYWPLLKPNLLQIMKEFYNGTLDLSPHNKASIVLLPKKEIVSSIKDFRPISIINLIPKIIAKTLANRLTPHLNSLISNHQTAFLKGRLIAENFIVTRELIHHVSTTNNPTALIKLNFSRAFDSVQWYFLHTIMVARGFPPKWLTWISQLLSTSSSRLVINGENTPFFQHAQGLRQGDPISHLLFLLAVDVLQQMVRVVNALLPTPISRRVPEALLALQYADDTMLLAHADESSLITLKLMLRLFSMISGLGINYSKSSFIPFNMNPHETETTHRILGCAATSLPITYLGLPLTIKKPGKSLFMPLIEKLEKKTRGVEGETPVQRG